MTEGKNNILTWANCIATSCPTVLNKIITVFNDKHNPKAIVGMKVEFCADNGLICLLNCIDKQNPLYRYLTKYKGFVVNISTLDILEKCCQDIPANNDLSYSKAENVNAPRIDDALVSLECEILWNKEYYKGSNNCLFCAKVVGTSRNETYFNEEGFVKSEKRVYVERLLANLNPNTGKPFETYTCYVESE
jgi:flavin reductase (DIM6/NTAB) family NADH-FMN oxidoreductase RutF